MFCANCGNKLADGSNFCPKCGNKVGEVSEKKQTKQTKQTTSSDSIPIAAQTYFEKGQKYQKKKDYDNAYDSYQAAIEIAPAFSEAQKRLVEVCLVYDGGVEEAEEIINDVISNNPDDYEAFLLRGKLYKKEDTEKSLMDFEIALKLKPDYLEAYKEIIFIYTSKKNWNNIIKVASEAIKNIPNDAYLYNERGTAFARKESYDNAISDYSKALEINPNFKESISSIALSYYKTGDNDKALTNINRYLEIIPGNADALYIRGQIYFSKGDYEKTLSDFELVEKHYGDNCNPLLYKSRAIARYKTGWYDTHQDIVNEDYLKLSVSDLTDGLDFFKDIMIERYKKAHLKYKNNGETFLIKLKYNTSGEISDCVTAAEASLEILNDDYPITFFDKSFADDFCGLVSEKREFISCKNIRDNAPAYWFIFHAKTGEVYKKGGMRTWSLIENFQEDAFKYNNIEDAIKDYEKIIRTKKFGRNCDSYVTRGSYFIKDGIYMDSKYFEDKYLMDLYIVGSY
jgi:tetratricopeptide (TPR) repeat protein